MECDEENRLHRPVDDAMGDILLYFSEQHNVSVEWVNLVKQSEVDVFYEVEA
jgi:hypothetical protein